MELYMIPILLTLYIYIYIYICIYVCVCVCVCCGLQIRPLEEQLKQRVIGERYCISRKRKSYKRSTSRSQLAVCLSNVS